MAEEDDVDILGDSNLKNDRYEGTSLVFENDLLNCEYTIHPQWLLDKPSANPENWYSNTDSEIIEKPVSDIHSLGHLSTENCINDESGWTLKEKNLLERGIDIFGKSNIRLSQFIGSKTSAEVRYFLKNFHSENQFKINNHSSNVNVPADILDEKQIPASMEVVAAASTRKRTLSSNRNKKGTNIIKKTLNDASISNPQILNKRYRMKSLNKSYARKFQSDLNSLNKIQLKSSFKYRKLIGDKKSNNTKPNSISTISPNLKSSLGEITTGNDSTITSISKGEQIVKLEKIDEDINVEVEVDDNCHVNSKNDLYAQTAATELITKDKPLDLPILKTQIEKEIEAKVTSKYNVDLLKLDEETFRRINSVELPKCEMIFDPNHVTQIEKVINWDYFEERSSKTMQRYLKIRSHIINTWLLQKPKYFHKTSSRQGLKNCGDVNDIGRIHQFLEQIGAINFGCEQVAYIRPLSKIIYARPLLKEKAVKESKVCTRPLGNLGKRQRTKKKFINDGEGGYTLTHNEKGEVIRTTIIDEKPHMPKQRLYIKKPSVRLIYCRSFTDEEPQPYSIKFHFSTIITMDFHAHLSDREVMGLVAGYWMPQDKSMIITHYEPCLNIASSATHCDMCPISQATAAEFIHQSGLDILGWFHTHPTFSPEPSLQDIDTQQTVQQWIGHNRPCIGVILSPFISNSALIASPYRCLVVDTKLNFENQLVPYKFDPSVIAGQFDIASLLRELKKVQNYCKNSVDNNLIDFTKPYFLNTSINHLEKFISSVQMRLNQCKLFSKTTSDMIIQQLTDSICTL